MKISIVIPVLNEKEYLQTAVERAWESNPDEVIVVDGGSNDGSRELLDDLDCRPVDSQPGRGVQLNAGAAIATGEVVLFLHVDTYLATNGCEQIRDALGSNANVSRGCFQQTIDNKRYIYRLIEFGNSFRASKMNLPYGDQGLFFRRAFFEEIGKFPNVVFLEDYILSKNLRGASDPLLVLDGPLEVSARRWEHNGPLRQTFRNWWICLAHRFGSSPAELEKKHYTKKNTDDD